MKLYTVPLAPNPTKVMLYIAERAALGVEMGIEQITVNTVKGRHKEPAHLARNPFGTLPVLEVEEGRFILESHTIMEYLDERYPDGNMLGSTPVERAFARDLERIVELRIATHMGTYGHMVRSPLGRAPDPEGAGVALRAMQPAMDYLETLLSDGRSMLLGERVSMADCTLQASLQFMRYIEQDILGERPLLRKWDAGYRDGAAARAVLRW
ncbi:glutathione S-transferase family protein [Bradyrhizobium sp. WSM2254]|uniref:glutathione S-transferase family protein n=1 Tax=Bradyrhizobium sp. WSM2254 TaxID=1188263 RepID=UPI000488218A|nr:glutathione S-transferase family protein [Bradyrhizobium sp. WSM2254]